MKKLALVASLILCLSACSLGNKKLAENDIKIIKKTAYMMIATKYCSKVFSDIGKEKFFKEQYRKNNLVVSNYVNNYLIPNVGNEIWEKAKLASYIDIYELYHGRKMTINAFLSDPKGMEIIEKRFNKSNCSEGLSFANKERNLINNFFLTENLNHLIIE